jgi:negative regulator of flagellin synthesis FlgM
MIDQIKPKNLGTDLNTKVSSESASKKVEDSKVSRVAQANKDVESNYGKVSQFISKEKVKKMASEPPIDKTAVTRIKTAIANGTYPLDLDKLADALLDAHKEIK